MPEAFRRYRELQEYVGWTEADADRVRSLWPLVEPAASELVDDFYAAIARNPNTAAVITGGEPQIARLRQTLLSWLRELFTGPYDEAFVVRRWKAGVRHVELGLDQVYTNAAGSRLRSGLLRQIQSRAGEDCLDLISRLESLSRLLDLDMGLIEFAYQQAYHERVQRLERMATLGQVAGGVAHELRNPLNVIKTSAYFLQHVPDASSLKTAEHLSRITSQVDRAERVIAALSSFTRVSPAARSVCPVAETLHSVLRQISQPTTIRWEIPPEDAAATACVDAEHLAIVLRNVLQNAVDAQPTGGCVRVRIESNDEWVLLVVSDDGPGIAAEHLSRVSEPFFSTKSRGLGLGLATSRVLLERNRGSLNIANEPGAGAVVTIRLPSGRE
jgi:signal transduction histidine kinase